MPDGSPKDVASGAWLSREAPAADGANTANTAGAKNPGRAALSPRFHDTLSWAAQALLYALFALTIGYFSTNPPYRLLNENEALLRLSFMHAGKPRFECRQRTPEELARLPPQMRAPIDCPRERSPVVVRVELDGQPVVDEAFAPAGLARDGASAAYRRLPITAGPHRLRVQVNDDARVAGFLYEREVHIDARPGQVVLIDFNPEHGGVLVR